MTGIGLFYPGSIAATPAALAALEKANVTGFPYLARHLAGDWGDMDEHDKKENDYSLGKHLRLFSAYNLPDSNNGKIWIITEADRSATTILLPGDY